MYGAVPKMMDHKVFRKEKHFVEVLWTGHEKAWQRGGKRQNHQQLMELKRNNLEIEFQLRNNGECSFFLFLITNT